MSTSDSDAHVHGAPLGVQLEVDALALAEGLEEGVLERVGAKASSARSVSRTTRPSRESGSYMRTTPCTVDP